MNVGSKNKSRKGSQATLLAQEKEECDKCDRKVEEDEKAVLCDICNVWFHQACGGIVDELYETITKFGHGGTKELPWQCNICRPYDTQMMAEIVQVKQKQEKVEKK